MSSVHNYFDALSSSTLSSVSNYYIYGYRPDGKLISTTISTTYTNGSESFTYDDYDRVTQKVLYQYKKNNSSVYFRNTVSYTYKTDSTGSNTSMLVGTYTSTVNSNASTTYTYTYDNNGYITKIVDSNGKEVRYFYDDIGQLIREDNELKSYTYTYDYDISRSSHWLSSYS